MSPEAVRRPWGDPYTERLGCTRSVGFLTTYQHNLSRRRVLPPFLRPEPEKHRSTTLGLTSEPNTQSELAILGYTPKHNDEKYTSYLIRSKRGCPVLTNN